MGTVIVFDGAEIYDVIADAYDNHIVVVYDEREENRFDSYDNDV